jgi:hypothetical protein
MTTVYYNMADFLTFVLLLSIIICGAEYWTHGLPDAKQTVKH